MICIFGNTTTENCRFCTALDCPSRPCEDVVTTTRYLEHGDVVTINGEKYLCEQQSPDSSNCKYCAFNGYRCLLPKELNYDCSSNWVAMIKIKDVINRELKEIDEHQRYIKYLKEL